MISVIQMMGGRSEVSASIWGGTFTSLYIEGIKKHGRKIGDDGHSDKI